MAIPEKEVAAALREMTARLEDLKAAVSAADADAQRSAVAEAVNRLVIYLYNHETGYKSPQKFQRVLETIEAWERVWRTKPGLPLTADELLRFAPEGL